MQITEMIKKRRQACSGCQACANACPCDVIQMEADEEGFLYPIIDEQRCVQCGQCDRACTMLIPAIKFPTAEPEAYAFMHEDDAVRKNSSSGGIFSLLAEQVLDQGGIVFGAAFDAQWEVGHVGVDNKTELTKLRGSKYVQSNVQLVYRQVREELLKDRVVLFSGTPCQVEGLQQFLGKKYEHLWLLDLICHGVPSPLVWKKYVEFRSQDDNIREISFRNKNISWERFLLEVNCKCKLNTNLIKKHYQ